MLAEDEIRIAIGNGSRRRFVFLRPTLRAAMRLNRAHGGFDAIVRAILDENVTVIAAVIRESEEQRSDVPDLIESLAGTPLYAAAEALKAPLIRHVMQLAGIDDDTKERSEQTGETIPFEEHHARLYRIATGWLGWTPEVAWTSTAAEITEAFKGRTEMLKAIFGSGDDTGDPDAEQSPEVFNSKLSAALAMASARFAQPAKAA